ncbi:MAG TPA: DUF1259 domain-containing protein [Solirubrobacteraceae bacterium]|nr:DUF1259 domain-containing protein [Solirubrobacteraceae bacterium]
MSLLSAFAVCAVAAGTAMAGGQGRSHHPQASASTRHSATGKKHKPGKSRKADHGTLPTKPIESAMQAQGTMINGDLSVGITRTDLTNVTLNGVPIKPSFQLNGEIDFQSLGHGRALMNGDLAFKPGELDAAISAIVGNHLTFQAEHQHMYDFSPAVWFIHLRAKGNPVTIAREVHNVIKTTSTPLPQSSPSNPPTPLDKGRLQKILHGYDAEVSDNGVVTVYVARRNPVYIDGIRVNPATNIATNVSFEPLNSSGTQAAVIPDFAMQANEINRVVGAMRARGWDIGCLYNQETGESPQLYFSHEFKTGDPYQLAQEVRDGLNQTNAP